MLAVHRKLALLRGCAIQVAKKRITLFKKVRDPLGLLQTFTIPAALANMAQTIPVKEIFTATNVALQILVGSTKGGQR
jgi:hypothetical protein